MKKTPVFVLILLYTTLASCQTIVDTPNVLKGTIDLSGYEWNADNTIRLDGEWEFYWERILLRSLYRTGIFKYRGYGTISLLTVSPPAQWGSGHTVS